MVLKPSPTLVDAVVVDIFFSRPVQFRSRKEQEIWDSLLVKRSEFERARDAYKTMVSSNPEAQQRVNAELAASRQHYHTALQAFTAYVHSTVQRHAYLYVLHPPSFRADGYVSG